MGPHYLQSSVSSPFHTSSAPFHKLLAVRPLQIRSTMSQNQQLNCSLRNYVVYIGRWLELVFQNLSRGVAAIKDQTNTTLSTCVLTMQTQDLQATTLFVVLIIDDDYWTQVPWESMNL